MDELLVDTVDGLTVDWLTTALRSLGHEVAVSSVRCTPIGTGQMGASYRLGYEATGGSDGLPPTYVVKLAALDPGARTAVVAGYRAEVAFYREVAATVAVRTPRCHLATISEDGTVFTLLLEDLAPAEPGDQIAGADPASITAAAVNLAGLHGPRWDDPTLDAAPWVSVPVADAEAAAFVAEVVEGAIPLLAERVGDRVAAADLNTLERSARAIPELVAWQRHSTVLHGDYRLDNLLFGPDGSVAAVDWQTLGVGLPTRDLAYLVSTGLTVDARRDAERNILAAYRDALTRFGVDYDEAEAFDDYRVGLLQGPLITVLGAAYSARTARGDEMFAAMTTRVCAAIEDLDVIELLSSSASS